jgi:tRNA threonylcarbamoyladenosine biosynthesis protein TsaB
LPDKLVLGFDTSAAHCAAVLLCGDTVLAERSEEMAKGQAERLMPMLTEVLADAGCDWRDLALLGVGIGPGNFTGIRLSVSAARGLSLGLGVPAVGISLLEALAYGTPGTVLCTLDARRGQIYAQRHGRGVADDIAPMICGLDSLPETLAAPGLACIGHAAPQVAATLGAKVTPAAFAPASSIARIAAKRGAIPGERPAPLYLRGADAAPPREAQPVILP